MRRNKAFKLCRAGCAQKGPDFLHQGATPRPVQAIRIITTYTYCRLDSDAPIFQFFSNFNHKNDKQHLERISQFDSLQTLNKLDASVIKPSDRMFD